MEESTSIETEAGLIAPAIAGRSGVRLYKSIPFASAQRWAPPQEPMPWDGVRLSDSYGCNCPQPRLIESIDPGDPCMSEDCLTLDIWTPTANPDASLPILIWIPGGAYLICSTRTAAYDGTSLASRGIVVVALNYRVGVFGFLAHPELTAESPHGASGNYGLLDQIAALRWIRDNIANFGGDPDQVTIAGHSAGATSVNILMVSPLAKGLFHRAFAGGGSAMPATGANDGSPLPREEEEKKGVRFAQSVGAASLAELRALPMERLVEAGGAIIGQWAWNSCIDGYVLPSPPAEIMARRAHFDIPLMVGWTENEGAMMAYESLGGDEVSLDAYFRERFNAHADRLAEIYPSKTKAQERASKVALSGDGFVGFPTWSWARLLAKNGTEPVFVFFFSHSPNLGGDLPQGGKLLGPPGAFHGCEIPYFCGNLDTKTDWIIAEKDRKLEATLSSYLSSFVRTGDPNGSSLAQWRPYDMRERQILCAKTDGVASITDRSQHYEFLGEAFASAPDALRYRGMQVAGQAQQDRR